MKVHDSRRELLIKHERVYAFQRVSCESQISRPNETNTQISKKDNNIAKSLILK